MVSSYRGAGHPGAGAGPRWPRSTERVQQLEQRQADTGERLVALYVERHRGRLISEAAKARAEAVTRLRAAIGALAEAREEAVAAVTCGALAVEFPGETADPSAIPLQQLRGGRIVKAIPGYTAQLAMISMLEALESDAAWLNQVAKTTVEDKQLDPARSAVWETSPEGQEALNRRRKLDRERALGTMRPDTSWEA